MPYEKVCGFNIFTAITFFLTFLQCECLGMFFTLLAKEKCYY